MHSVLSSYKIMVTQGWDFLPSRPLSKIPHTYTKISCHYWSFLLPNALPNPFLPVNTLAPDNDFFLYIREFLLKVTLQVSDGTGYKNTSSGTLSSERHLLQTPSSIVNFLTCMCALEAAAIIILLCLRTRRLFICFFLKALTTDKALCSSLKQGDL